MSASAPAYPIFDAQRSSFATPLFNHRFRDTFAVELLLAGVPIERVSVLLGHSSVKMTEKYYAPWTHSRRRQVEADLQRAWRRDPIVLLETKGTQQVRGKSEVVH